MNSKKRRVVVFGTSDFARQVFHYFRLDSEFTIVAFTVNAEYNKEKVFLNLPVVDFESVESIYPPSEFSMFIAVGYHGLNKTREEKFLEAKLKGYNLVSYICTKNTMWDDIEIGENCFVMEDNVFQIQVKILDNVIIGMGNRIGHNSQIGRNCFISINVSIGGYCKIMNNCFIGLGSIIRDKRTVGENNILGAGTIILNNTEKNSAYIATSTPKSIIDNKLILSFLMR